MVPVDWPERRPPARRGGCVRLLQHLHRRLEAFRWATGQLDHLTSQRGQDIPVCRIARPGQRHPITLIESGQEAEQEGTGRACGQCDLIFMTSSEYQRR